MFADDEKTDIAWFIETGSFGNESDILPDNPLARAAIVAEFEGKNDGQ